MNFRRWRLGVIVALFSGLLAAGAGLVGDMGWKSFVAVLCVSIGTNLRNWLQQHPVEDISFDTTTIKKKDQNENIN